MKNICKKNIREKHCSTVLVDNQDFEEHPGHRHKPYSEARDTLTLIPVSLISKKEGRTGAPSPSLLNKSQWRNKKKDKIARSEEVDFKGKRRKEARRTYSYQICEKTVIVKTFEIQEYLNKIKETIEKWSNIKGKNTTKIIKNFYTFSVIILTS